MKHYTLGLIFNSRLERVVLMHKNRPDWQKGKLNGVGGRVERGESSVECMVREAREETTFVTKPKDWAPVALLQGKGWKMDVYTTIYRSKGSRIQTCTDEKVSWYGIKHLPARLVSNVPWLIYLAAEKLKSNQPERVTVTYQ